jgi:hypothetical protein
LALQAALADPILIATSIQLIRAIGIKRLTPIIAVIGVALGMLASRNARAGSNEVDTGSPPKNAPKQKI